MEENLVENRGCLPAPPKLANGLRQVYYLWHYALCEKNRMKKDILFTNLKERKYFVLDNIPSYFFRAFCEV